MKSITLLFQNRLRGLFDYLQDPYLVARFQHVCGIRGTFSPAEECERSGESGCFRGRGRGDAHERFTRASQEIYNYKCVGKSGEDGEKLTQNGAASLGKPRRKNSLTGDAGQEFIIGNRFLFYLFTFGTELGNELFYLIFFPFVMWNVDALVGRRIIMVWAWVMYLGQCTKDLLGWSRPASPPVVKVEMFYNSEYSMPSTHAMSGTAIPFALFYMTHGRWEYPFAVGFSVALSWCVLVCVSRIYMGMHSVLDVLAGVLYSSLILLVSLPALDLTDLVVLHSSWAPLVVLGLPLFLAMLCFRLDAWSTSRGDTAQILGSGAGITLASHVNARLGISRDPLSASLALPNITAWLLLAVLLRMLIGVAVLVLTRAVMKALTLSGDVRQARQNMHIELPYRYIVYSTVGFNVLFLVPLLFSYVQL
uniref:Sphingosine-1-phosphate phosphatase 1 n=1 Tax=Neogobius melanostomus TaxID=47308 RepID=A0A8C6SBJ2_9GOBI